ncbi:MAG: HlyD family efflux transporter periplasmic adaptor subunit [Planctomycetota bacterium]
MPDNPIRVTAPSITFVAALLVAIATMVRAEEQPASASDSQPELIRVSGVFESLRQSEVSANNEQLTNLKIVRVLPFGTAVEEGQSLVWFEAESLADKLREAETELELARIALEADQFDFQQFLKLQKLDREKAKRSRDEAQQEFDNYQRIDRELQIKQAKNSLESSKFSLDSATEEYRQLEQMYKEDDLTEESEEIVLRRAKYAMERAAYSLERSHIQTERTIKQTVPRNDASQEDTLARALLAYDTKMREMDGEAKKRKLELERKEEAFKKQSEKFKEMQMERKRTVLKSAIGGFFIHGQLNRGKFGSKPALLKKGDSVTGKQILGTVVDPARLQVRVDLPEDKMTLIKKGVVCEIEPKGIPDLKYRGVVKSVGAVPYVDGKFDCVVAIRGKASEVIPGMNCDLLFVDVADKKGSEQSGNDTGDKSE